MAENRRKWGLCGDKHSLYLQRIKVRLRLTDKRSVKLLEVWYVVRGLILIGVGLFILFWILWKLLGCEDPIGGSGDDRYQKLKDKENLDQYKATKFFIEQDRKDRKER